MENESSSLYEQMMQLYENLDAENAAKEEAEEKSENSQAGKYEVKKVPKKTLAEQSQLDILLQRINMHVNRLERQKSSERADSDACYTKLNNLRSQRSGSRIAFIIWILTLVLAVLAFIFLHVKAAAPNFYLDAGIIAFALAVLLLIKPLVLPYFENNMVYRVYADDPFCKYLINDKLLSTYNRERDYHYKVITIIDKDLKQYEKIKKKLKNDEPLNEEEQALCENDAIHPLPIYTYRTYSYSYFDMLKNIKLMIKNR